MKKHTSEMIHAASWMLATIGCLVSVGVGCNGSGFKSGNRSRAASDAITQDLTRDRPSVKPAIEVRAKPPSGLESSGSLFSDLEQGSFADVEIEEAAPDLRSNEEKVCQDGMGIANRGTGADYAAIFGMICNGNDYTEAFDLAVANAFEGEGEPMVQVLDFTVLPNYSARIVLMYAIKAPLSSPAYLTDIRIWDVLSENGVNPENTSFTISIDSRNEFPGRGSLEAINLSNQIKIADGAAIYDIRKSQINSFLFTEEDRNLNMTTEHLVEPETAKYYQDSKQVIIGFTSNEPGKSIFVYTNELVIKERIDPERIRRTIVGISKEIQKITINTAKERGF